MASTSAPINPPPRKYHEDKTSEYALPNDTPELERLAVQAQHLAAAMNNKVIHAPIEPSNTSLALDVGCGTGVMTRTMANALPSTQCYGLDLSAVAEAGKYSPPPNLHFLRGNILSQNPDQWVTQESGEHVFAPGSAPTFDYIFSRLLILGIPDWPGYVKRAFTSLRPGGWFEVQDLASRRPLDADGNPQDVNFLNTISDLMDRKGMDLNCGLTVAQHMRDVGFQDVQVFSYRYPHGAQARTDDSDETRAFAEFSDKTVGPMMKGVVARLAGDELSEESMTDLHAQIDEYFNPKVAGAMPFIVTIARKPE